MNSIKFDILHVSYSFTTKNEMVLIIARNVVETYIDAWVAGR